MELFLGDLLRLTGGALARLLLGDTDSLILVTFDMVYLDGSSS